MYQQHNVYKRYSSKIKNNTIILLKQQQLYQSQQRQQQCNPLNDAILFKSQNQRNLQPLILKKFEDYFTKNIEPKQNMKIFNKFIQTKNKITLNQKMKQKHIIPMTSRDLQKLVSKDQQLIQNSIHKQRNNNIYSSKSKYQILAHIENKNENKYENKDKYENNNKDKNKDKDKNKGYTIFQQSKIKQQNINSTLLSNPIHILSTRNRKRQRLNQFIDLSLLLSQTFTQGKQKNIKPQHNSNHYQLQQFDNLDFGYLKIQSSILVDRKPILLQTYSDQKVSKQQELKKAIRTKIVNRKRVLQESYKDKMRSRSPSPVKHPKKINFLQYINPSGKQEFTLYDVIKVSVVNSKIDQVKMNMSGCFFSVYVAEGNNSELIKSIVRGINGWRVAELPEVANFVWTQSYRKNLVNKKPKKIVRDQILQNQNQFPRIKQKRQDLSKLNQTFLVSRNLVRKNSGSDKFLKRKSLQRIDSSSRSKIYPVSSQQNYPELSLSKHLTSQQPYSYQNQLRKLLPVTFECQNFLLKSQKDSKKVTITPNYLIHNHLIGHRSISDKKNLLFNLRKLYFSNQINPFQYIPESHDIISCEDQYVTKQTQFFLKDKQNAEIMKKQVWIVKPGEDSNRGRGIVICKGWEDVVKQIGKRTKQDKMQKQKVKNQSPVKQKSQQNNSKQSPQKSSSQQKNQQRKQPRTMILQRYIVPLLYQGRKFDIRSYMLVTWVNNVLNGYAYEQCYIRTSSKQFDIDSQNKYVHLTNDAIQNMSHQYGKYEQGNKVSEMVFSKYFDGLQRNENKSWDDIKKQMSHRCRDILKSSSRKLVGKFGAVKQSHNKQALAYNTDSFLLKARSTSISPDQRTDKISSLFSNTNFIEKQTQMSFELFGLDFMIDQQSKLWLIQVNTNPAINHDCSRVLNKLIPKLLDNTFAIAVMPYMRPSRISDSLPYHNQFHHIYQQIINQ